MFQAKGQELWNLEFGASASKDIFIGQVGTNYDGAPTAKNASSFGNIRGLAPSDPTREGSYYSASISNFGLLNDLNPVYRNNQKLGMGTYSIALAAPLPTIQVPIPGSPDKPVTIVPFAKSLVEPASAQPREPSSRPTRLSTFTLMSLGTL